MSGHPPDRSPNPLLEARLRRSLRPVGLSARQRARHLQRLDERGDEELRYLQQRSLAELGLLTAALVAVLAVAAWFAWPTDTTDEPTQLEMAQATLTSRAEQPTDTATSSSSNVAAAPTSQAEPSPTFNGVCVADQPATDPPASIPRGDPAYETWYGRGNSDIWLSVADRKAFLPPLDFSTGLWFAGGPTYLMWYGTTDRIVMSATQLNGVGHVESVDPIGINTPAYIQHHIIEIPEPGCWEITGTTETEQVVFLVDVRPVDERPDLIFAQAIYDLRPYPEPATCQITPWTDPESRFDSYSSPFWLDGASISLFSDFGWYYAGEELFTGALLDAEGQSLKLNARPMDNPGPAFSEDAIRRQDNRSSLRLTFPTSGCWKLETITESGAETFRVYVYPAECRPDIDAMEIPSTCRAPESS